MEPTTVPAVPAAPDAEAAPAPGSTRRMFIRGIAAAGASTAATVALERSGVLNLETAAAQLSAPNDFSSFAAIAASPADVVEVPEGYRADLIIGYGDVFANDDGEEFTYGYNNDWLAFYPLGPVRRRLREGLIFVNHEYPSPFFQHGNGDPVSKTVEQIEIEREAVGNSVLHVRLDDEGLWRVVERSVYNRRITGAGPDLAMTGPLAGNPAYPGIGTTAAGSLANCSGGTTPWGTALSCEENYQDYGNTSATGYGWTAAKLGTSDYVNGDGSSATRPAKYGWVCEHDPYDPSSQGRKHTALGRFRHENTAFRAERGKPFVLYMGDDRNDGGVYKFVSDLPYRAGRRAENLRILESGTLYVARWEPVGRRVFDAPNGRLTTPTSGTGYWREVREHELVDTHTRIIASEGLGDWLGHFATNRPEDLEVDEDGTVYIALTNNSNTNDVHGSIRRLREAGNDATAVGPDALFRWEDYAAGGPTGSTEPGREGFSSPDNLVFDRAGNLWVVTDVSSSALNRRADVTFHGNNAVFMIPRTGPNAGVAFRFANMPVQSEGTGPYFTPDERTLFLAVQHPGEESSSDSNADPLSPESLSSFWPAGNATAGQNPAVPRPAMVAITKVRRRGAPGSNVLPAPAEQG